MPGRLPRLSLTQGLPGSHGQDGHLESTFTDTGTDGEPMPGRPPRLSLTQGLTDGAPMPSGRPPRLSLTGSQCQDGHLDFY